MTGTQNRNEKRFPVRTALIISLTGISFFLSILFLTSPATSQKFSETTQDSVALAEDTGFAARFYHAIGTTLAYRMRDLLEKQTQSTSGAEDELELDMLDDVDLAARRFDQHIARLLG